MSEQTSAELMIRDACRAEIDMMIDWAAKEGWNPGLDDAAPFWAADPGGFLVGTVDEVPVCAISVVRYPGDLAFLGFYIVHPLHRGQGHGWAIWQAGMARVAGCNVALDGVVAQQGAYRKSGFTLAHRNIRFGGKPRGAGHLDPRVVPIGPEMTTELLRYDQGCFGVPREAFLRPWVAPPRIARALVDDGRLRGYGVVRACRQGYKIGPLLADGPELADLLFQALTSEIGDAVVYLDVPEPNLEAVRLAERWGLAPAFETARMYTGSDPGLPLERIFGITSFELG